MKGIDGINVKVLPEAANKLHTIHAIKVLEDRKKTLKSKKQKFKKIKLQDIVTEAIEEYYNQHYASKAILR